MAKARMRVEVRTAEGEHHSAEESLPDGVVELMAEAKAEPSTKNRMRLLDAIVEKGTALVLRVAGALSRARTPKDP